MEGTHWSFPNGKQIQRDWKQKYSNGYSSKKYLAKIKEYLMMTVKRGKPGINFEMFHVNGLYCLLSF